MAEFDFEYQGYYKFIEDCQNKDAHGVIFENRPNDSVEHIQDESWISDANPLYYLTNKRTGDQDWDIYYDLKDWQTDETVGEIYCPDGAMDGNLTINGTTYNYVDSDEIVEYQDDQQNSLYGFNRTGDQFYRCFEGFVIMAHNLYEMVFSEDEDAHEWGVVIDDDGGLPFRGIGMAVVDITDEVYYTDLYNNRQPRATEITRWIDRENKIADIAGREIKIDEINTPQDPNDVVIYTNVNYLQVMDNGLLPVEKTTINVERSFYDEITSYPEYYFYGIRATVRLDNEDNEKDFIYPLIIARFRENNYSPYRQIKLYIDPTIENPFDIVGPNHQLNGFNPCVSIYNNEFEDYIELNIIDDITPDPGPDPEPTPDPDPEPTPEPEPEYDPEKAYKKMKELSEGYMFFDEETKNISYLLDIMRHNLYNGKGELVGTDAKLFKK